MCTAARGAPSTPAPRRHRPIVRTRALLIGAVDRDGPAPPVVTPRLGEAAAEAAGGRRAAPRRGKAHQVLHRVLGLLVAVGLRRPRATTPPIDVPATGRTDRRSGARCTDQSPRAHQPGSRRGCRRRTPRRCRDGARPPLGYRVLAQTLVDDLEQGPQRPLPQPRILVRVNTGRRCNRAANEPTREREVHVGTHAIAASGRRPRCADRRCVSHRSIPRVGTATTSAANGSLGGSAKSPPRTRTSASARSAR
jgi:hypothetical protein